MIRGLSAALAGIWIAAANSGCASPAAEAEPEPARETIPFREIASGAFSGIQEPRTVAVTNLAQWRALWEQHSARKTPANPPPEIDFEKETVLFLAMGRRNTGGYSIRVEEIVRQGNEIVVRARTKSPPPGGFTIQALTAPFQIVAMDRMEAPIKFEVRPEARKPAG